MTPCPLCGRDPDAFAFGGIVLRSDWNGGEPKDEVICSGCRKVVGAVPHPPGVHGVGSWAREAWERAVAAWHVASHI